MVFLIDEHIPANYNDSIFHRDIYARLKRMCDDNSLPHLLFHGPHGSGKKTMVNAFLHMIYGDEVDDLCITQHKIPGSGKKVKKEIIKNSRHHIIINPTGTNFDKYLVHDIIKKYAMSNTLDNIEDPQSKFRVIQISDLDKLSHSAQNSLRRMIETNTNRCRFVMLCTNLSNVISPLASRCVRIRVPRPEKADLFAFLVCKSIDHKVDPDMQTMIDIVEYSECNIKTALWYLQMYIFGYDFKTKNNYYNTIDDIAKLILRGDLAKLDSIREMIFNIIMTNYNVTSILRDIENKLIKNCILNEECKLNIILKATQNEYNLVRGRRYIIHFDAFVTSVMALIKKYSN